MKDCTWEPIENLETNLVWLEWKATKRKESVSIKGSKRKRKEKTGSRKKKKIVYDSNSDSDSDFTATPLRKREYPSRAKKTEPVTKRKLPAAPTFTDSTGGFGLLSSIHLLESMADIDFSAIKTDPEPTSEPPLPAAAEISEEKPKEAAPATFESDTLKSSPKILKEIQRLRSQIDTESRLVQACMNLTATIDEEDDLLSGDSNLVHQPLKAQTTMCRLIFAQMCPNINVDFSNPPIIWAMNYGESTSLCYPRKGRASPSCWLPTDLTYDRPVLPVAYESFPELTKENEIYLVIGLDLLKKTFLICWEEGEKYPAEEVASLSGEEISDICAYSTLPKPLEKWVQQHPTINEKHFCEQIGRKMAKYILEHSSALSIMGLKFKSADFEHLAE